MEKKFVVVVIFVFLVFCACSNSNNQVDKKQSVVEEIFLEDTSYVKRIDSLLYTSYCRKDLVNNNVVCIEYIDKKQMLVSVSRYIYYFDDSEFYGAFYHKLLGKIC